MLQGNASSSVLQRIAGLDLGDIDSYVCILDRTSGEVIEESRIKTRPKDFQAYFERHEAMQVAIEVGAHSNWTSQLISTAGHAVTVANAARVRLIHGGTRKNDRLDAEKLARLLRYDRSLLAPIQHRGMGTQHDLAVLRSREALVKARTMHINHVRGIIKPFGARIPKCDTKAFAGIALQYIPPELLPAVTPHIEAIENLTRQINDLTRHVVELCRDKYPVTSVLTQVHGVAEITALTFILTVEDPFRFRKSRDVAAYVGLVPGQKQSGASDPARRITKAGDRQLRRLLVQCAQRILGKRGIDSDLKRHGERIASSGSKDAKRRAVVAIARKLAVLLHCLWVTGEVYEPLRNSKRRSVPVS